MAAMAELKSILGFDATAYKAGVKEVTTLTSSFQKSISGIGGMLAGAFSVGAIIAFGRSLMETAHQMDHVGEALGLTMDKMVALKTLGAENNLNFDDMAKVLGKVRDAQGKVVELSKKHEEALAVLKVNADEFVGAGTDKALELIANGYVRAGETAEAFAAINELFGGKIGRKTISMLIALNKEGLEPLIERTKDAADGFQDMADMQATLDKFWASIENGTARAIKSITGLKKHLEEFVASGGIVGAAKRFVRDTGIFGAGKRGPVLGLDENGDPEGQHWPNVGKPITAPAPGSTDVTQMHKNQAEAARKKSEEENKKAQELGRHYYFKELKNQDEIQKLQDEYDKKIAELNQPGRVKGIGATVDNIMKVGGQIGMSRPGLAIEDRAIRIQQESKTVLEQMRDKLQILIDKQDTDRDRDEG